MHADKCFVCDSADWVVRIKDQIKLCEKCCGENFVDAVCNIIQHLAEVLKRA